MTIKIAPVIMSGGSGTRLWPLSTPSKPKQFHALASNNTMIQESVLRLRGEVFLDPIIICGESHLSHIDLQFKAIGVSPLAIILEPMARNTAAVAAIASLMMAQTDPEALILMAPADHVIHDVEAFRRAIIDASETAKTHIVTFGIKPSRPETGYGYIERGIALNDKVFTVAKFLEKPDLATAQSYLLGGRHDWNAGIFLFSPNIMLRELEALAPDVLVAAKLSFERAVRDGNVTTLDAQSFAKSPSISIDYAIMEKTAHAAVIACDIGWFDVGSFAELYNLGLKDEQGNFITGKACALEANNVMIRSDNLPVCVIGLDDIMVVVTDEGVLVAPIDRAQDVKKASESLKNV